MVPTPIANALLTSATLQLQQNHQFFHGKSLVMGKFSDELAKQLNQTSNSQQMTAANAAPRAVTFLPVSADTSMAAGAKNTTSRKGGRKKQASQNGGTAFPGIAPGK